MGRDKMKMELGGLTFPQRAAMFWAKLCPEVLIASGYPGHLAKTPPGVREVYDVYPHRGPLGALHAGLLASNTELVFFCAGDMPCLSASAALELIRSIGSADACIYLNRGRPEPLFGLYRKTCLPAAERLLEENDNSMHSLLRAVDTVYAETSRQEIFTNLNTPEDVKNLNATPIITFVGKSGTGKTTFIEKLIPELKGRGIRLGVIKHDVHGFEMDREGKDTWRFTNAGADIVAIASGEKFAMVEHLQEELSLQAVAARMPECDLIITEGYKKSQNMKIEIHRRELNRPLLSSPEELLCVITDEKLDIPLLQLALDDVSGCADIITDYMKTVSLRI